MTKNNNNTKISDDNIFSELSKDTEIIEENWDIIRDWEYYMRLISNIFWYLNLILIFIIWAVLIYNYIQWEKYNFESNFMKNNCSVLTWKWIKVNDKCMTVTASIDDYKNKIKDETQKQIKILSNILPKIEKIDKLTFSDNIAFLLKKSDDRLKPLEILTEFEKLRYSFLWTNKDQITCKDISLKDNILTASCTAFSADFDEDIPSYDFKKTIIWTSATIAASFLNYIDKKSNNFKNIEKQEKFKVNSTNNNWFTKKTDFKLKLEYNPNSNLSL